MLNRPPENNLIDFGAERAKKERENRVRDLMREQHALEKEQRLLFGELVQDSLPAFLTLLGQSSPREERPWYRAAWEKYYTLIGEQEEMRTWFEKRKGLERDGKFEEFFALDKVVPEKIKRLQEIDAALSELEGFIEQQPEFQKIQDRTQREADRAKADEKICIRLKEIEDELLALQQKE